MRNKFSIAIIVAMLAILALAFLVFDIQNYLNLAYFKAQQDNVRAFYHEHRAITLGTYFLIYILVTAFSLPGATVLTLAGGALFGLGPGLVLVSFASTIGATLAFLVARTALHDFVQNKFGDRLQAVNEGVRRDGGFYLFTLRLVPLFPFFVINLVMGLTPIRTFTFYWVSQLGMLPGTILYVNAGRQLAKIDSLSGILSPEIAISFALLGIFPLAAKKILALWKVRRALKKWPRPKSFDANVIVIGAGSGGLISAYIAAAVKAKVVLIEKNEMGGDCLNTGCVPSKALIRAAKAATITRRARDFGFTSAQIDFTFSEVMERVQRVIKAIEPHDSVERYESLGVTCMKGEARLVTPYEVSVNGRRITARNMIIATGASPLVPSIEGIESIHYWTSDTIWNLRHLPQRLLIIGGGPIGCELAQAFQRLGSKVTIVDMAPAILGREDADVSAFITQVLIKEGITLITGAKAKRFLSATAGSALEVDSVDGIRRVEFDEVLLALGRQPRTQGFGLEELGVRLEAKGTIEHDEFLRTNIPNIYCVGDVAGPYQFTHFAAHQAWYAAVNALFSPFKSFKADDRVIPRVTFTDPEVASVGLSEREAKEKGIPYEVTIYDLGDMDRALADEEAQGFVKVLTAPGKDRILGATVVGAHAGETFVEFVSAMKHGIGLNKILGTIHAYPTFAEANKLAAGMWKKAHAPQKLLTYVEKFHRWRRSS
jgi:dihydrolipoamide dehydrogenase